MAPRVEQEEGEVVHQASAALGAEPSDQPGHRRRLLLAQARSPMPTGPATGRPSRMLV